MKNRNASTKANAIRAACLLTGSAALAGTASAYTGPGLGMATITVVLGFFASIFIALFAIIWYPFKRMLKKRKKARPATAIPEGDATRSTVESGDQIEP